MQSSSIRRIMYASIASPFAPGETAEEWLETILAVARHRNAECGLTGVLVFEEGRVAQMLEGAPESVEAMFATIARDPRHHGVTVLRRCDPDSRAFESWNMAYGSDIDLIPIDLAEASGALQIVAELREAVRG